MLKFIQFCMMKWPYLKSDQYKKRPRSARRLAKLAADLLRFALQAADAYVRR